MINDLTARYVHRAPRLMALVNGQPVAGVVSFDINNNSHYQADTFSLVVSLSKQPPNMNWAWWASQASLNVELFAGFPPDPVHFNKADLKRYMYGRVDKIDDDPGDTHLITLTGRDLTGLFIDAKTTEKFQNLTASQIVQQLAKRHGLAANVTPTGTKAGTYYQLDHARMNASRTEWDLMTFLAREENYNLWLDGQTVYFQPYTSPTADPYVLKYEPAQSNQLARANAVRMSFSRSLTLAQDVMVHVRSWHGKAKKSYVKTAKAAHSHAQSTGGSAQEYWFNYPGLTPEQCQKKADSLLQEITKHEKLLHATLPGDDLLTTRSIIQVTGTGTAYDQIYYPSSIRRRFGIHEGYQMMVEGKNHAVETDTEV